MNIGENAKREMELLSHEDRVALEAALKWIFIDSKENAPSGVAAPNGGNNKDE